MKDPLQRTKRTRKNAPTPLPTSVPASQLKTAPSGIDVWICVFLIGASIAVYAGVSHHQFLKWDDNIYVTENPVVRAGLTWQGVQWAFTSGLGGNWHPLTWLSHMLDVQLFGMNASAHHITNVTLHTINCILLFAFLCAATGARGRSAFVAGLFAVHPLHVESVAWVSERKDVLSAFFCLLMFWQYCRYSRDLQRSRYGLVLMLFALGLMSKPMLVTVPLVLLLMDAWPLQRVDLKSDWVAQRTVWARLLREKAPFLVLSAAVAVLTFILQREAGATRTLEVIPISLRIGNAIVSYAAYIGALVWPAGLAALYPIRRAIPWWWIVSSGAALFAASLAAIRLSRRLAYLPVGWLWFVMMLMPVIGLIQVGDQSMADRYMYLPSIGLCIIIAWGTRDIVDQWPGRKALLPAFGGLALVACAVLARRQVHYWENNMTLWTRMLEVTRDNDRAHNLIGDALMSQGKYKEAAPHFFESVRIKPNNAYARNSLGDALSGQGKLDEAIPQYMAALRLKPDLPEGHYNLANALLARGRIGEAAGHFFQAARLNPGMPEFQNGLGIALLQQGKTADAIRAFLESARLKPNADAHINAGLAFAGSGNTTEARRHFKAALEIDPNNAQARVELERLSP
jgi:Flp pilus assembly protein TadD